MVDAGTAGSAGNDTGAVGLENSSVGLNSNRDGLSVQGRGDGCSGCADLDIGWVASIDLGSGGRAVFASANNALT